ncbi:hypothetical protein [Glycomyces tarimensis]
MTTEQTTGWEDQQQRVETSAADRAKLAERLRDMADAIADGALPMDEYTYAAIQYNLRVRDFADREDALAELQAIATRLGVDVLHSDDRHQVTRIWGSSLGVRAEYKAILWEDSDEATGANADHDELPIEEPASIEGRKLEVAYLVRHDNGPRLQRIYDALTAEDLHVYLHDVDDPDATVTMNGDEHDPSAKVRVDTGDARHLPTLSAFGDIGTYAKCIAGIVRGKGLGYILCAADACINPVAVDRAWCSTRCAPDDATTVTYNVDHDDPTIAHAVLTRLTYQVGIALVASGEPDVDVTAVDGMVLVDDGDSPSVMLLPLEQHTTLDQYVVALVHAIKGEDSTDHDEPVRCSEPAEVALRGVHADGRVLTAFASRRHADSERVVLEAEGFAVVQLDTPPGIVPSTTCGHRSQLAGGQLALDSMPWTAVQL